MKKRLISLLFYSLFWLLFFIIARIFFLVLQYQTALQYQAGELLATFLHGLKLDISMTAYFLVSPVLFILPDLFFRVDLYRMFIRWYTYILIVLSSILVVSDANLYSYWGFRMDYTPMLYLKTPGEAMASISTLKAIMYFVTITAMSSLFIFIYRRYFDRLFSGFKRIRFLIPGILFFLLLLASLIIPIRGGFGIAPINAGSVYFSQKMFLNHAAINSVWNVGQSAINHELTKNPYVFADSAEAKSLVDPLTVKKGKPLSVLSNSRPNIMIIVLESFSGYLIGPIGGDSLVTPNFNRYVKEGILFSGFYASGTRTDKALPAILNGYPAMPAQSIIKEPKKTQHLEGIVKLLTEQGYNSSFWYGGEINFANFNSFVIGSGFRHIITKNNFGSENYNSKWGVHDHVLFQTMEDSMKNVSEPFIEVALTLSSHEPFDVPMEPVFAGDDNMTKYKNSVFYADRSLGAFLDWAKTTGWWKNTLIILVADHCCRISPDMPIYSQKVFKIPMLWIGGALSQKGISIGKLGTQVDIGVTLFNQLGIPVNFPFGKDLLSEESSSFAFYTFNEGFGFITDSTAIGYDQKLRKPVYNRGAVTDFDERRGKAYLQVLLDDYLKR